MIVQIFKPLETDLDTFDGNKIGEIPAVISYQYTKHWQKPGSFTLVIGAGHEDESKITEDSLLLIDGDWLLVVGTKPTDTDTTITGTDLKGYLKQRITLYSAAQDTGAQGYDVASGSTETVLKHYVSNNAANPEDPNRKIPRMVVSADQHRGLESDNYMARLENLADVEENICINADVGYSVEADYPNNQIVFDIVPRVDKTEDQIARNRVVFAVNRGNVISLSGERDAQNYQNVFYATKADGNLEADAITQKVLREGATEATGPYRREVQVNVSADSISEIETYARHEAENYIMADSYTVEAGSIVEYGAEYALGDVVTVKDISRGKTADKVIIQAEKSISGVEKSLRLTFGDSKRKLISGINENVERAINNIKKLVIDKAAKEDVKNESEVQKGISDMLANALGGYHTDETSEDGSVIHYFHDQPLLADSTKIWKKTIDAFGVSTDGGQTWSAGITADGSIVAKIIEVAKIVSPVNPDAYFDLINGVIGASKLIGRDYSGQEMYLRIGKISDEQNMYSRGMILCSKDSNGNEIKILSFSIGPLGAAITGYSDLRYTQNSEGQYGTCSAIRLIFWPSAQYFSIRYNDGTNDTFTEMASVMNGTFDCKKDIIALKTDGTEISMRDLAARVAALEAK